MRKVLHIGVFDQSLCRKIPVSGWISLSMLILLLPSMTIKVWLWSVDRSQSSSAGRIRHPRIEAGFMNVASMIYNAYRVDDHCGNATVIIIIDLRYW